MKLKKILVLVILALLSISVTYGQQIHFAGVVKDEVGEPLAGVIVTVSRGNLTKGFTTSDADGQFKVDLKENYDSLSAKFSILGYATKIIPVNNLSKFYEVELHPKEFQLKEVSVKPTAIRSKGDTIVYNVDMLRGKSDRNIEDVIRRLPGVDVTQDGAIYYNGEQISRFYIENLDMLGGRYKIATQNISPDDIGSISVYENHVEKRVLKDISSSNRAAMNISLKKKSLLRPIGYVVAGAGVEDNMTGMGEIFSMFVAPKVQYLVTLKGNNTGRSYSQELAYMSVNDGYRNTEASRFYNSFPYGRPDVDADRFLDNVSAQTSVNTIFKLTDYMTVKANAGYSYEQKKYGGSQLTEYFEGDKSRLSIVEKFNARLNEHTPTFNFSVVNNAPRNYFMEQLRFSGHFYDNLFNIDGSNNAHQTSRNQNFSFDNIIQTDIRRKANIISLYSNLAFSRTPFNNLFATSSDNENQSSIIDQHLSGSQFYTKETAGYAYGLSRVSLIGIDGVFTANYDKFFCRENVKNNQPNEVSGYKINTTASLYYQFKNSAVTWYNAFILLMNDMNFKDLSNKRLYDWHKPFIMFKSSVNWDYNQYFKYNFSVGRNLFVGSISDFILFPVYSSFNKSTIPGSGEANLTQAYYIKGGTNFRNAVHGLFGSLTGNVSYNKRNFMKSSYVDESMNESMVDVAKNDGINASVLFDISKHLSWLGGKVSLNSSWMYGSNKSKRSGLVFDVKSNVWKITPGFTSSVFNGRLDIVGKTFFTISCYDYSFSTENKPLLNIRFDGRVSWWIIPNIEWRNEVSVERSSITTNEIKTNVYYDSSIRMKLNKFEIEIHGKNLTGRKSFSKISYNDYDVITRTFGLRGREGLLTLKYSY